MPLNPATPVYGKTAAGPNEAIGCTTPTAATQALTLSGNANEGEQFTIGLTVYTWTAIAANYTGQTANYVKIGVDAATSITNAAAAITGAASKGTLFSNNTRPNPLVTAVATSSTVLTITATNPGADGNGIATTETMANAAWGAATTTGGVSASLQVTGPGGSAIPVTPQSVTQQQSVIVPAGTSQVIPIGAKEWTVSVLTGTATVNGAAGCPAGFSDGSTQTLLNTVTITTAATSTAYVRWAT